MGVAQNGTDMEEGKLEIGIGMLILNFRFLCSCLVLL